MLNLFRHHQSLLRNATFVALLSVLIQLILPVLPLVQAKSTTSAPQIMRCGMQLVSHTDHSKHPAQPANMPACPLCAAIHSLSVAFPPQFPVALTYAPQVEIFTYSIVQLFLISLKTEQVAQPRAPPVAV